MAGFTTACRGDAKPIRTTAPPDFGHRMVIDGQLVILNAQGKSEFHRLRGRCAMRDSGRSAAAAASTPAAVFVFDLLELKGKDLRGLPLLKRKAALQK
jgi:ATP-dependent DNA ligase